MEATEKATLNAAETQLKFVDDNNAVWTGDVAFQDGRDELHDEIEVIKAYEVIQKNDNTGIATGKQNFRFDAATKALGVCKIMKVFARRTGNATLRGEIDFSFSDLYYGDEELLVARWKTAFDRATSNLGVLVAGGYHITGPVVAAVGAARTAFITAEAAPGTAKVGVKTATFDIKAGVKTLDDIAEDMIDLAVGGYGSTNADFVKGVEDSYRKGNAVFEHLSLVLHYVDDVTGVVLKGIKVTTTDGIKTFVGHSTKLGNRREKGLANGNYIITSEMVTYVTDVQSNVGIEKGKIKKITVRMRKV